MAIQNYWLKLPAALWMMIGLIAMVKIANVWSSESRQTCLDGRVVTDKDEVNAISSYVINHKIAFLHTKANKLTGFLLFIGMMAIGQSYFIPVAWVIACFTLFAAIQEGHIIRSR